MKRAGIVVLVAVGLMLGVAAFAFAFGTPQAPMSPAGSALVAPEPAPDTPIAASAPAEESAPFAVQIPGCTCHSDDPAVVEEHSQYRINECRSCHAGGSPKMGDR